MKRGEIEKVSSLGRGGWKKIFENMVECRIFVQWWCRCILHYLTLFLVGSHNFILLQRFPDVSFPVYKRRLCRRYLISPGFFFVRRSG